VRGSDQQGQASVPTPCSSLAKGCEESSLPSELAQQLRRPNCLARRGNGVQATRDVGKDPCAPKPAAAAVPLLPHLATDRFASAIGSCPRDISIMATSQNNAEAPEQPMEQQPLRPAVSAHFAQPIHSTTSAAPASHAPIAFFRMSSESAHPSGEVPRGLCRIARLTIEVGYLFFTKRVLSSHCIISCREPMRLANGSTCSEIALAISQVNDSSPSRHRRS